MSHPIVPLAYPRHSPSRPGRRDLGARRSRSPSMSPTSTIIASTCSRAWRYPTRRSPSLKHQPCTEPQDPVYIRTANGKILFANKAFARLMGRGSATMLKFGLEVPRALNSECQPEPSWQRKAHLLHPADAAQFREEMAANWGLAKECTRALSPQLPTTIPHT